MKKWNRKNFYMVGYSSHSSSSELDSFMKSIHPKKVSFHSDAPQNTYREFQQEMIDLYTSEGVEKVPQIHDSDTNFGDFKLEVSDAVVNRFKPEVKRARNKELFLKANPFMKNKKKRHTKASKLTVENPIIDSSFESLGEFDIAE